MLRHFYYIHNKQQIKNNRKLLQRIIYHLPNSPPTVIIPPIWHQSWWESSGGKYCVFFYNGVWSVFFVNVSFSKLAINCFGRPNCVLLVPTKIRHSYQNIVFDKFSYVISWLLFISTISFTQPCMNSSSWYMTSTLAQPPQFVLPSGEGPFSSQCNGSIWPYT